MTDFVPQTAIGTRVSFWCWNAKGEETQFTGTVVDEFTDPEDYRPSYHVKLDAACADYPNEHRDPYVSECVPERLAA